MSDDTTTNDDAVRRYYIERKIATMGGRMAPFYQELLDAGRLDLLKENGEFRPILDIKDKPVGTLAPLPAEAYERYEKAHAPKEEAARPATAKDVIATISAQLRALPEDDLRKKFFPGLLLADEWDLRRTGAFDLANAMAEKGPSFLLDDGGKLIALEAFDRMGLTPQTLDIVVKKTESLEKAHSFKSGADLLDHLRTAKPQQDDYVYGYGNEREWCGLLPLKIRQEFINAIATADPQNPRLATVVQELVDRKTDPDKFKGERVRTRTVKARDRWDYGDGYEFQETVDPFQSGLGFVAKSIGLSNKTTNRWGEEIKISNTDHEVIKALNAVLGSLKEPFVVQHPEAPKVKPAPAPWEKDANRALTTAEQDKADVIKDKLMPGWRDRITSEPKGNGWAQGAGDKP